MFANKDKIYKGGGEEESDDDDLIASHAAKNRLEEFKANCGVQILTEINQLQEKIQYYKTHPEAWHDPTEAFYQSEQACIDLRYLQARYAKERAIVLRDLCHQDPFLTQVLFQWNKKDINGMQKFISNMKAAAGSRILPSPTIALDALATLYQAEWIVSRHHTDQYPCITWDRSNHGLRLAPCYYFIGFCEKGIYFLCLESFLDMSTMKITRKRKIHLALLAPRILPTARPAVILPVIPPAMPAAMPAAVPPVIPPVIPPATPAVIPPATPTVIHSVRPAEIAALRPEVAEKLEFDLYIASDLNVVLPPVRRNVIVSKWCHLLKTVCRLPKDLLPMIIGYVLRDDRCHQLIKKNQQNKKK